MPWNDNNKPGPWSTPGAGGEGGSGDGRSGPPATAGATPSSEGRRGPWSDPPGSDGPERKASEGRGPWSVGEPVRPRLPRRLDPRKSDPRKPEQRTPEPRRAGPRKAEPGGAEGPQPRRSPFASLQSRAAAAKATRPKEAQAPGLKTPGLQTPGPGLDELASQLRAGLKRVFSGRSGRRRLAGGGALLIALAFGGWALSGVYRVQPDQQAVVTRLGAYAGLAGPGLDYHLPAPIERVALVPTAPTRLEVGGPAGEDGVPPGLMLTSDGDIADVDASIQWRVKDAQRYLFQVADPQGTLKTTAEGALRQLVGQTTLRDVLGAGRPQLQSQAKALMQRTLDSYGAGIIVSEVRIRSVRLPADVGTASADATRAGQEAQAAVGEANAYRDRVTAEAKGDASRLVLAAQGYSQQSVLQAQGEADRFNALDAQYRRAPALTRQRLYLETMQQVLTHSGKVVVDMPKGETAPIVLPPGLFRRTEPPAAAQTSAQQAPTAQTSGGAR